MPQSSELDPRPHLLLDPSETQLFEEDASFDELQRELQRLQHELQQHGRSLFGVELPNQTPAVVAPPQQPRSPEAIPEDKDRGTLDVEASPNIAITHYHNRKMSKNERNLKIENHNLRKQLAEDREELHRLRALKSVTEEKMASRIEDLEGRLKILLQNEKKLEKRRAADAQGWRSEFTALWQRLQSAEHRQKKLLVVGSIKDEDHRETVLARHRKLEKLHQKGASASASSAAGKKNTRKSTAARYSFGSSRQEEEKQEEKDDVDILSDHLGKQGLQECMVQLSEELNALKSALGSLEQQFYLGEEKER